MVNRNLLKPFSKGWYRACLDEYLQSDFLKRIGASASDYLYACEQVEQVRIQAEAKKKEKKWKKQQKEMEKGISKTECFEYFKELSIKDPIKYDKVLKMLGIDPGMSLYAILFKGGK